MKKETVVAIVLGILLGAVIAIVLIISAKREEVSQSRVLTPSTEPTISPPRSDSQKLSISEPKSGSLTSKSSIIIKGKAPKGSLLVIQSQQSEKIAKLKQPEFSVEFPLILSENTIRLSVYFQNSVEERVLTVYRISE